MRLKCGSNGWDHRTNKLSQRAAIAALNTQTAQCHNNWIASDMEGRPQTPDSPSNASEQQRPQRQDNASKARRLGNGYLRRQTALAMLRSNRDLRGKTTLARRGDWATDTSDARQN